MEKKKRIIKKTKTKKNGKKQRQKQKKTKQKRTKKNQKKPQKQCYDLIVLPNINSKVGHFVDIFINSEM
jgi:sorbitol-specific phosphotransferase system component IIBC